MKRVHLFLCVGLFATVFACGDDGEPKLGPPSASPTATSTLTHTPSPSFTRTATPTATTTSTATYTVTVTASPTPTVTVRVEGAVALFSTDSHAAANPFPSDRLLDATGHVQIAGAQLVADLPPESKYNTARDYADQIASQLAELTGFSTWAPIRVKFDQAVNISDGANPDGILVLKYDDPSVSVPLRAAAVTPEVSGDFALEIRPIYPLDAKTRYVYVVTKAVHDAANRPVQAAADLRSALSSEPAGPLATWRSGLSPALEALRTQHGIATEDIAAIDYFTTQPTTDDLVAIKDLLVNGTLPAGEPNFDTSPIPQLHTGIFQEGTPEYTEIVGSPTSSQIAAVAVGTFKSYDFRNADATAFDPARVGGGVVPTTNDVDFYVTIPKAPAPPGGYPIALFCHGLGGSGRDVAGIAKLGRDVPIMGIGISAVEHGLRGNVINFFNFVDIFATRDSFRQTVADFLQLERMVRNATLAPFDQVDKSRIHFAGGSLGGIIGTVYMGVEPDVRVGFLSVPGGGLASILVLSPEIGNLLRPLVSAVVKIAPSDPFFAPFLYRYVQVTQWAIDPADPINTAPFIISGERNLPGVPPKTILMHEGIVDNVVPNPTTENLALAMGLSDLKPARGCSNSNGCSGIWRFVMTEYGLNNLDGHGASLLIPEAGEQVMQFLLSDGREVIDATRLP